MEVRFHRYLSICLCHCCNLHLDGTCLTYRFFLNVMIEVILLKHHAVQIIPGLTPPPGSKWADTWMFLFHHGTTEVCHWQKLPEKIRAGILIKVPAVTGKDKQLEHSPIGIPGKPVTQKQRCTVQERHAVMQSGTTVGSALSKGSKGCVNRDKGGPRALPIHL